MALIFSKQVLSGSSLSKPIQVDATSSPGTAIHASQATATGSLEMVYLYAVNTATADRLLTIEWGATATGNETDIPLILNANEGVNLVIPGWPLSGTATSECRAVATATGEIRCSGFVHRAT